MELLVELQPKVENPKWRHVNLKYVSARTHDRNEIPTVPPMFLGYSYPMGIVAMLYDWTGRNLKWKFQDGGHMTWNTYISACIYDSNQILTATPMFLGTSYPMGIVAMTYDWTERDRKIQSWNTYISACTQDSNKISKATPTFSGSSNMAGIMWTLSVVGIYHALIALTPTSECPH